MILPVFFHGTTESDLNSDTLLLETTRRSQLVRTRQSILSFVLVAVVGIAYTWALWGRVETKALLPWSLLIVAGSGWRSWISYKVRKNLPTASAARLVQNESDLIFTAVAISFLIGAGHWLLTSLNDSLTIQAVTLLSCTYAVGATVNTLAQRRVLAFMIIANLGQGALYFASQGVRADYAMAIQLFALTLLLMGFAKRFESMFIELVKSDLTLKAQNETLKQNRIEIEKALTEAVNANRTRSQFIASASHDLSQPLHAMSMFIDNLKQTVEDNNTQKDLVAKIELSAERLKQQFDGLLDLTRYDAGGVAVHNQTFDLNDLVSLLVETEKPYAVSKKLKLHVRGEPFAIHSDPVLLGRLIGNLLANAIKFTESGHVEITVGKQDGRALLVVSDTGCGFNDAEKERIFSDFVQLGNSARSSDKGAGLGLSIVRRIAYLLNIEVTVKSQPGIGSEFALLFPLQEPAVSGVHHYPEKLEHQDISLSDSVITAGTAEYSSDLFEVDIMGANVLVVDDDPDILDALRVYVESRGGCALLARDVSQALLHFKQNEVSFAVVDDMLEDGPTGLDLARSLSADLAVKFIIIVTGNINQKRLEVLRSSGFGVFSKPLSVSKLDEIISQRLQVPSLSKSTKSSRS